ncbi:AAA family ATPase [Streptococcus salivarius]|uniref:AAA family ATPase n=1 Tax=Streptococcus salivarius TaxID=1304 RepID=UPI00093C8E49|nr:AAA family ATPase [Streptococcus salivarius]
MKLIIDNIGNVNHAEIEIKGITIIAGYNGTGKSTISRSLFSIFSANYDVINKISSDRTKSINKILSNYLSDIELNWEAFSERDQFRRRAPRRIVGELIKIISNNLLLILDENFGELYRNTLKQSINESIDEFNNKYVRYSIPSFDDKDLDAIYNSIEGLLSQSDQSIFNQILTKHLKDEFHNQINNIYDPVTGTISLQVKEEQINVEVSQNIASSDKLVNFRTDVVYIDDAAAIVDNIYLDSFWYRINSKLNHNSHLIEQMEDESYDTYTLRARTTDRLNLVFGNINDILRTESVNSSEDEQDEKKLNIVNYSSGMKTFYLIKSLLEKGVIRENGTLILDEPEVHLHPEWQLKFAEIIVLLQKEFGLHILINTHSPYLLNAIEVYSKIHKLTSETKYYLAKIDESNIPIFEDIKHETNQIYDLLTVPFEKLDKLEELLEDNDD